MCHVHSDVCSDHNMWNYLYMFVYLEQKDKDEYTAAEEYIAEQVSECEVRN
jgi:hypothetical protein